MNTTQTQINHLIKTLAEQLRHANSFNGMLDKKKERRDACFAASKTIADLEKLGVHHDDSFSKAESLNEAMAA